LESGLAVETVSYERGQKESKRGKKVMKQNRAGDRAAEIRWVRIGRYNNSGQEKLKLTTCLLRILEHVIRSVELIMGSMAIALLKHIKINNILHLKLMDVRSDNTILERYRDLRKGDNSKSK
jgi:hypothetical protein